MEVPRTAVLLSVNLAAEALPTPHDTGKTGIGKHPLLEAGDDVPPQERAVVLRRTG